MADKLTIKWNGQNLGRAVGLSQEVGQEIGRICEEKASRANSMSASYKTAKWHDHATKETKGGKSPNYVADVERKSNSYVGIVYTGNYAAMKDNHEHNTLAKVLK